MHLFLDTAHFATLLRAHGLAGELEPIQTLDRGPLYRLAVDPMPLLSSWQTLRNLTQQNGYWPLVIEYSQPIPAYQVATYGTDHYHYNGFLELEEFRSAPRSLDEALQEVLHLDAERDLFGSVPDDQWFADTIAAEHTGLLEVIPEEEQDVIVDPWNYYDPANAQREQPATKMSLAFLLVPTAVSWYVPLILGYGATYLCPRPEIHAGVLRYWGMHYAAEPVILSSYMQLYAQQPPSEQRTALHLAWQQQQYCPAILASGEPLDSLAARLFHGESWSFPWSDE
jgi:hypothetical protein